jgi:hypothetical protein
MSPEELLVHTQDAAARGLMREAQDELDEVAGEWVDSPQLQFYASVPTGLEGVVDKLNLAIRIIRDQAKRRAIP